MKKAVSFFPYENRNPEDLAKERWRDLPGYTGEYQISSLGRIKSLRRWRACGNNSGYYTKEFIRKQNIRKSGNKSKKDFTYSVTVALKSGGKSFSTSTARLVYYSFVKKFDLNDKQLVITYIDNEGRNISYQNLKLTTISEKSKKSIKLRRSTPYFLLSKVKVRQLTIAGKEVAQFQSIKEAADKTGFARSAISACVKGKIYHHHRFRWQAVTQHRLSVIKPKGDLFNTYLWEKLGRPRFAKSNPPAVLNLCLEHMKAEHWKPLTIADQYVISSLGRVKLRPHFKHNYDVWQKEKILRLVPDGKGENETGCLLVSLSIKGKKKQVSVARLVYSHFVRPFNLNNKK